MPGSAAGVTIIAGKTSRPMTGLYSSSISQMSQMSNISMYPPILCTVQTGGAACRHCHPLGLGKRLSMPTSCRFRVVMYSHEHWSAPPRTFLSERGQEARLGSVFVHQTAEVLQHAGDALLALCVAFPAVHRRNDLHVRTVAVLLQNITVSIPAGNECR